MWNTHLKKRLASKNGNIPRKDESKEFSMTSSSCSSITFVSSSSGKRSLEVELEQQWDEGSVTKKPREAFAMVLSDKAQDFKTELSNHSSSPSEEPKELSSSSNSSNNSNITNSSQVDVSNPEDQAGSLFNFIGVYDANNTSEEVNKPEISDIAFDIPLESDLDFWNMLDNLGSFQCDGFQSHDVEGTQSTNFGEG